MTCAKAGEGLIPNADNHLTKVESCVGANCTPTDTVARYDYDAFGRRLSKEGGGARTSFFYSDEGLIGEYSADGTEQRTYGYEPDSLWGTNPIFQKVGSKYYWYLNDHLGTPQKIVDSDGSVVWSADYEAFGKATVTTAAITNNLRFPGQYYDAETGLHYNWHRYYDPQLGRFTAKDPIDFAGGDTNLYAYVMNDLMNRVDPLGLFGLKDLLHAGLNMIAIPPYALYYVSYNAQRYANELIDRLPPYLAVPAELAYAPIRVELWTTQAVGLGGNATIDWVKGHTINNESVCDEGKMGSINPFHQWMPNGFWDPQVYLPGIHANGSVDFAL